MAARFALLLFISSVTIRPYVPPNLDPEPEFAPSEVRVVEIQPSDGTWDTNVLARPSYVAPLAGNVQRGAHIAVRGELKVPNQRSCPTRLFYALVPLGWICSSEARPSNALATTEPVLSVVEGSSLPYRYAMVLVEEGSFLPMWGSLQALHDHAEPERQLGRGDTIALAPNIEQFEGESYYVTVDDKVVPTHNTHIVDSASDWQGVVLTPETHLPFGWVTTPKTQIYSAPDGPKIEEALRRTRFDIFEEQTVGKNRWLRIGDERWVKGKQINVVRKIERPAGTGTHPQWFDVDLGEQVVVAYRNDQPVYATLTSSGREPNHTPRGNYPIWGKVTAITMKSQEYDDVQYYVNRVPWVMFFQAHNALHGAYWHDRFGITKSHGCANLSPKDAHYLFDWLEPALPAGWTAIRNWDLTQTPVAHVHDSHKPRDMFQERNVGPPDKGDEAERLDKAVARREAKERDDAAAAASAAATPVVPAQATAIGVQPIAAQPAGLVVKPVPIAPVPAASR
jgi:hypothetical protein